MFSEIKTVKAGLFFILILIIGIGIASYKDINEVFETAEWRANSYNILNTLGDVLAEMASSEEGQRSYIITGDDSHLETYQKGLNSIKVDLGNLRILFKNDKAQLVKLDKYEKLIFERYKALQETINTRKFNGFQSAADKN